MSRHSCKCEKCVEACHTRPCWTTPQDAERLIKAGYAHRLMDDWWVGDGPDDSDIRLLCPAVVGYEGDRAPEADFLDMIFGRNPFGRCTFLNSRDECELHAQDLKPKEGRQAFPCQESQEIARATHRACAMTWNNEEAQALVKRWHEMMVPRRKGERKKYHGPLVRDEDYCAWR